MKGLDPDLRALQEVRDQVARAKAAAKAVAHYSQAQIDRVCQTMAEAGARAAYDLARLAVEETGIGRVHYKILKNLFGSEGVWDSIKDERTVGFLSRDESTGVHEVATPVGVVAGIVPTTNPTSTTLYKALVSVKGRNAVVISPHPRSKRCISETVEVLRRAIERAGAPADLVTVLSNPTIESTGALMKHRDVAVILSTGGSGLVRAAYSSGKPAYGVGPGNVPAYVDRSADPKAVAEHVTTSQSFDNATLCCSEQALVLDRPVADATLKAMVERGAHLCSDAERQKLEAFANVGGHMNPDIVGIDPWRVAEMAGFSVPRSTTVLLAHQDGVGKAHKLSIEILCPLLSVHLVDGWQEGCAVSKELLHYGGLGHTMSVHATDQEVLDAFFLDKPASRIVANGPSSMGAVGYSTNLIPSFSLGCGPQAGNITSDNISARHLVNVKRVAFPRRDWKAIERSFHERAAAMTGDPAPRGSGLPGDPGLRGGTVGANTPPRPASNWQGNPAITPAPAVSRQANTTPRPAPAPPARPGAAPTFTRPASAPPAAPPRPAPSSPRPQAAASPAAASPAVASPAIAPIGSPGSALSGAEIKSILEHAGSGCPLGPCKGCPHQDVRTGSCTA